VRLAISAGAPLPVSLERDVFQRFGVKVHNFYGATECGGIAYDMTALPREDAACIGAPMRNVSLSINTCDCLEVRGRNVGETYWPEPAPALSSGVYVTTDLAELKDGLVFLRGRASDVINVAGRKISPEQIERILATHPSVRECLVFGVSSADMQRGETVVACVVRRNGTTAEELRRFVLARAESWQAPREFWFVESLETNARGKLSRTEWRERFIVRSRAS
jgi:long-chain acyl-CoA synthetase